jgi:hypothetical protein
MLRVRLANVNRVASTLQEAGLIAYTRGVVTILDPVGLEARVCLCYRTIRDAFDRVLAS